MTRFMCVCVCVGGGGGVDWVGGGGEVVGGHLACDVSELAGFCVVWVSTRGFSIRVTFIKIFNHKFAYVKKCNSSMVYLKVLLDRDCFHVETCQSKRVRIDFLFSIWCDW